MKTKRIIKQRPVSKFHILATSNEGTMTFYDIQATSRRMAEVICNEFIEDGLKDDFGNNVVSFIVMDEAEYNNIPESFFQK